MDGISVRASLYPRFMRCLYTYITRDYIMSTLYEKLPFSRFSLQYLYATVSARVIVTNIIVNRLLLIYYREHRIIV